MSAALRYVYISICVMQFILAQPTTDQETDPVVLQIKENDQGGQLWHKESQTAGNISIVGDDFILNGKPFRIVSGSVHYFRLPAEYWRDRLRKLRAAGLNAVSTYIEWSSHEQEEGSYSFEGDNDLANFFKIAAEENLYVLLRPGPYICAERDLGGLPYWLLSKYPDIKLRTTDRNFIEESRKWMAKLFDEVKPFLLGNGGPIILVQVENEYGSYGASKEYMKQIRDIIKSHVQNAALLYTTDGPYWSYFVDGSVPETLTTIDFGPTTSVVKTFKDLRAFMPVGPLMNSEFYPGWLTHWTEDIQQVSSDRVVFTLRDMLENKMNVNFYVFFGGTNFEFTSGANYGHFYQPDITSYDYDAPLTEAGDPTQKYYAIRDVLSNYDLVPDDIQIPVPSPKGNYGKIKFTKKINLLSVEGRSSLGIKYKGVDGAKLPTFEELRQRSGLILYETTLNESGGVLNIQQPRDFIFVYVDKKLQGIISRMKKLYSLSINTKPGSTLSLLVENQGRINFGNRIHDFKGILGSVLLNNKTLEGAWSVTGYPLDVKRNELLSNDNISVINDDLTDGPMLFEGQLVIPSGEPLDTFIDPTNWGKGYIFVNGYNLGRYWPSVGPQVTLYVPGVWLKPAPAINSIKVIELHQAATNLDMTFIDYPILNRTGKLSDYVPLI